MNTSTDSFLGKTIAGYTLEELLGQGDLTTVYRAFNHNIDDVPSLIVTLLHVSRIHPSRLYNSFQERFFHMAEQIMVLKHPHILSLHGYGEQEDFLYLQVPDTTGVSLPAFNQELAGWTPQTTLTLLTQLTSAFTCLHSQGFLCRFFHPANVLIIDTASLQVQVQFAALALMQLLQAPYPKEQPSPYLAPSSCHLKSITGAYLGRPEYLAPEIASGAAGDTRSDIYALGMLLFELLCGFHPWAGLDYEAKVEHQRRGLLPPFHVCAPHLPIAMELVFNQALHRNPDRRFQSADAFLVAFTQVLNERISVYAEMAEVKRRIGALVSSAHSQLSSPRGEPRIFLPPPLFQRMQGQTPLQAKGAGTLHSLPINRQASAAPEHRQQDLRAMVDTLQGMRARLQAHASQSHVTSASSDSSQPLSHYPPTNNRKDEYSLESHDV